MTHLAICVGFIALGVLVNLLIKLTILEEQGIRISPWRYVSQHPYRSLLLAVSSLLCALLLFFVDQLNEATALLLGVAADQAADRMRARASTRIDEALANVGRQKGE